MQPCQARLLVVDSMVSWVQKLVAYLKISEKASPLGFLSVLITDSTLFKYLFKHIYYENYPEY